MITKQQALTTNNFEHTNLLNADKTPLRCRSNGQCKTWKTRPDEFKLPVKHGLYDYFYITQENAAEWDAA